jgi:hypothetical protein
LSPLTAVAVGEGEPAARRVGDLGAMVAPADDAFEAR